MKFKFIKITDPEYNKEVMLRWEVLRKPLGLAPGSEQSENEEKSLHLVALDGKKVIGCVLFHPESVEGGRLFQMAISDDYRGRGFGRRLIGQLEKSLIGRGIKNLHLYARIDTVGFFENLGYRTEGEPLHRFGIAHLLMRKTMP